MAKKKVINTSKTAHVMNLISKNYDPAPEAAPTAEEEAAAQAETAPAQGETAPLGSVTPAAGTAVPLEPAITDAPAAPTLPLLSADMEITAQIKSALEDLVEDTPAAAVAEEPAPADETEENPDTAVEEEPASAAETEENPAAAVEEEPTSADETEENPAAAVEEEPASADETEENPDTAVEEEPTSADETEENPAAAVEEEPALAAETEEAPDTAIEEEPASADETEENLAAAVEEEPAPADEEIPPAPEAAVAEEEISVPAQDDPEENVCINIMQELVEQSVDHYIKMFGLCTCSRCKADVKAIALTHLVPQYVVAPRREASFRVTIYHERFHGEVTAQILQACRIVMDKPRH